MSDEIKKTVVLGAGPAGVGFAWSFSKARKSLIVIEKMDHVGGMASTFKWKKYLLDLGPHKFYSYIPNLNKTIKILLKKNLLLRPKRSHLYLFGQYINYPIRIMDLILKIPISKTLSIVLSFISTQVYNFFTRHNPRNAKEYIESIYGREIYKNIFHPLSSKIWGEAKRLDINLVKTRVPRLEVFKLILNLFFKNKKANIDNRNHFYYPKLGFGSITQSMAKLAKKQGVVFKLNTVPTEIKIKNDNVISISLSTKEMLSVDNLISTMHLRNLVELLNPKAPKKVLNAANNLKHHSLLILYLVFKKKRLFDDSWLLFPEKDIVFNRLSEQKAFSDSMIPEDETILMVEITCRFNDGTWNESKEKLVARAIKDLKKVNIIKTSEKPIDSLLIKVGRCYPIYDLSYKKNLTIVLNYLKKIKNLYTIGRPGLFFYDNTDHSIDMGVQLANHLISNEDKGLWYKKLNKFFSYRIID